MKATIYGAQIEHVTHYNEGKRYPFLNSALKARKRGWVITFTYDHGGESVKFFRSYESAKRAYRDLPNHYNVK